MPKQKYQVCLSNADYQYLTRIAGSDADLSRLAMHARVLLLADECRNHPRLREREIARRLQINIQTVHTIRRRYATEGLFMALNRKKHRMANGGQKLSPEIITRIYDLSRSTPPKGKRRWSLRLLAHQAQEQHIIDSISHEAIGQLLRRRTAD